MRDFFSLLRIKQWIKNLFVFAPIVFSKKFFDLNYLLSTIVVFFLISFISSGLYILNDIVDIERDKLHPDKKNRPIASGRVNKNFALLLSSILIIIPLIFSLFMQLNLFLIFLVYIVLNVLYSFFLKKVVIIDVMVISLNFVLRVFSGSMLFSIPISSWLILCTIFLSLFLGFSKRRFELSSLGNNAVNHREVLSLYSIPFLDQMITVVTASTIISYALYTVSEETVRRFGSGLIYSLPFVLYGIFRYLFIVYVKGKGGDPTKIVTEDVPLIIDVLLWIIFIMIFIYFK